MTDVVNGDAAVRVAICAKSIEMLCALSSGLTQWKLSLSTNTIISHYGLPLLYTIATLAATRSCLLVYLSLLR